MRYTPWALGPIGPTLEVAIAADLLTRPGGSEVKATSRYEGDLLLVSDFSSMEATSVNCTAVHTAAPHRSGARRGARAHNARFARFPADFLSFRGVLGSPGILRPVASISQGIGPNGGVATPFVAKIVFSVCFRPAYCVV